jgi:hypothetical protein
MATLEIPKYIKEQIIVLTLEKKKAQRKQAAQAVKDEDREAQEMSAWDSAEQKIKAEEEKEREQDREWEMLQQEYKDHQAQIERLKQKRIEDQAQIERLKQKRIEALQQRAAKNDEVKKEQKREKDRIHDDSSLWKKKEVEDLFITLNKVFEKYPDHHNNEKLKDDLIIIKQLIEKYLRDKDPKMPTIDPKLEDLVNFFIKNRLIDKKQKAIYKNNPVFMKQIFYDFVEKFYKEFVIEARSHILKLKRKSLGWPGSKRLEKNETEIKQKLLDISTKNFKDDAKLIRNAIKDDLHKIRIFLILN